MNQGAGCRESRAEALRACTRPPACERLGRILASRRGEARVRLSGPKPVVCEHFGGILTQRGYAPKLAPMYAQMLAGMVAPADNARSVLPGEHQRGIVGRAETSRAQVCE